MVTTLTGSNSYGWQAKLTKLTEAFIKDYGDLAVERLDGQEVDFAKVNEALTSLPFLAPKRLVILHSAGANKQFVEDVEQILGSVPETTEVILVEPKLDKRLGYYKYLSKKTDFLEFKELDINGLSNWLVETAKSLGGWINHADARYLVQRVGLDQQLLSNELEKLLLYDSKISRQTIDLLTEPAPQSTIFQLLEAAFAGNSKKALELYAEQRALKVEPQQIVAMLTWQLNVLAIIKTAGERPADQIAKDARLNPFVVHKSQSIARQLSLAELKQLVSKLLDIDKKSKKTSIDIDEALQHYLLALAS